MSHKSKRLPPIPTKIATQHGVIPVGPIEDDPEMAECFGYFDRTGRRVLIAEETAHTTKWQTFWHEVGEVAVFDSGVYQILSEKHKDALLDAMAAQLTTMMLAGQVKVSRSWEKE